MGATSFVTRAAGSSAQAAFASSVEQAQCEHGDCGYTGTIAEKTSFVLVGRAKSLSEARDRAYQLIDEGRISDKWGPASCIEIEGTDEFVFFGWASS
jgi:hypothetical protein